jgi:sugar/nucleoside kinase (ribokinase family)
MPENFDAIVAGIIGLDIIPDMSGSTQDTFETLFLPGRLLHVGQATLSAGGPPCNTGLVMDKLGMRVQLMGKVGDDIFGLALKQLISRYDPHLADGVAVDETVSSSYSLVISPPGMDRIIMHCPGVNDTFGIDDVDYDLVAEARLFHFGYPPLAKLMFVDGGTQLSEIYRQAKETGVTTSLDMALPDPSAASGQADWPTILKKTLPFVDIFLPSLEEILFMLRRETYAELCQQMGSPNFLPLITPELLSSLSRELQELGAKIVCIKMGDRGFYLCTAEQSVIETLGRACPSNPAAWAKKELWTPCFQVDLVSALGSGDATIAGFLTALLRDMSPEAAVTAAVAVGACNVEAADTLSGIRSWDDTWARVSRGWPRHALTLDAPGWQIDDDHHLWIRL